MENKYLIILSGENVCLAKAELFSVYPTLRILAEEGERLLVNGFVYNKDLGLVKDVFIITNDKQVPLQRRKKSIFVKRERARPNGLPPKLARVMVNLTQVPRSTEIVDPFCGTGGILLEAAKLGHPVVGYDVDKVAIAIAKKRLAGFPATFAYKDACSLSQKINAIVTDLPYGKSTSVKSLISLYLSFLLHTKSLLYGRMIICFPHFVSGPIIARKTGYTVHATYTWHVHRSLYRELLVLSNK